MLDAEKVRSLLLYNQASGKFLWNASMREAGCPTTNGYTVIGIDGRLYLAHRLAWLVMTDEWPVAHIDHCNRIKDDNRWKNLRAATVAQNIANTGARSNNKVGIKGVSWCKATKKWRATITIGGKQRSLGRHVDLADAAAAYATAAEEQHGAYAASQ